MKSRTHLLALGLVFSTAAFGTARFSGEKGAPAHRVRLAAGSLSACAILNDGTVQCWGQNGSGQLGDGTKTDRAAPVTVSNLGTAVSIAVGLDYSCAILSVSGAVRCWGENDQGQLGNNTTASSTTPVAVSGLVNIVSLSAGYNHTCAVRVDGTAWCWGGNVSGQLGNGSRRPSLVPVQVVSLTGAVSIVASDVHTCALLANGTVRCWGDNSGDQLGNPALGFSLVPATTAPISDVPGVGAIEISAGQSFTCARLSDGSVSCWGLNSSGQSGDGTGTMNTNPGPSKVSHSVVALATGTPTRARFWWTGPSPAGETIPMANWETEGPLPAPCQGRLFRA
jgi:alpha-tubulin suppressor-like RCC1 family protein